MNRYTVVKPRAEVKALVSSTHAYDALLWVVAPAVTCYAMLAVLAAGVM
jgi:hypothetical protein